MTIINGKKIAKNILIEQQKIISKHELKPKLATILIGNNEASRIYINEKKKKAKKIGVDFAEFNFPADVKQGMVINLIKKLNNDDTVSGMIVQFPIPKHFDANTVISAIDPKKDADGFHQKNIKKFLKLNNLDNILDQKMILPVTPSAIMAVLNMINVPKNPTIAFVGKVSIFTKTLVHYFDTNCELISIKPDNTDIAQKSSKADILITACGKPHLIKANMVKQDAIVIDVGISRINGKVVGDVDFNDVANKASYITPVPGGIGPVTVAVLIRNVVFASLRA